MNEPDPLAAAAARYSNPKPAEAYPWPCEMHEQPAQRSLDAALLANAYLTEHDDTPLTTEKLVEMGGERWDDDSNMAGYIGFPGKLWVNTSRRPPRARPNEWLWEYEGPGGDLQFIPWYARPRNAGELTMLLELLKGR